MAVVPRISSSQFNSSASNRKSTRHCDRDMRGAGPGGGQRQEGEQERPLWARTAVETVAALRAKEVSPSQLVEVAVARIGATDASINAVPILNAEGARERARAMEVATTTTTVQEERRGQLHGLPLLIKDMTPVAGLPFVRGCNVFQDAVAPESHPLVTRLQKLGGIVLGKTNTPELGAGANTFNSVFGTTLNPWDTRLTPGGSSGGAAAALACGQAWLAQGSDLGGSLRVPASFTGTVGLRPTPGRVEGAARPWVSRRKGKGRPKRAYPQVASSVTGGKTAAALGTAVPVTVAVEGGEGEARATAAAAAAAAAAVGTVPVKEGEEEEVEDEEGMLDAENAHLAGVDGPMARTVPDLALFLDALVPRLTTEERATGGSFLRIVEAVAAEGRTAKGLQGVRRLAYSRDLGGVASGVTEGEVAHVCEAAVRWLETEGGFEVNHDVCPDLSDGVAIFDVLRAESFASLYGGHALYRDPHKRRTVKPEVVWNVHKGLELDTGEVEKARKAHQALVQRCLDFFREYDLLLTPAVMLPPFDHRLRYPTAIGTQPLPNYTDWLRLSSVVTLTCGPALSLPCGLTPTGGLPVGLQIIGPPYSEARVLALAAFFERRHQFYAMVPREPVAGTGLLVVYQGPTTEAEAAKLCGLEGEYGGGNTKGKEEKQEQRRRAAL